MAVPLLGALGLAAWGVGCSAKAPPSPAAPSPVIEVPAAAAPSAEPEPAAEPPMKLWALREHLRMLDCGHDDAIGELGCAFDDGGGERPVHPRHALHVFVTDPPGLVLAATPDAPANMLGEHEAVVADCSFETRGRLERVQLAAAPGVGGWLYGGPIEVGVASGCSLEPLEVPDRFGAAHLLVMHDGSRRKPESSSRSREDAFARALEARRALDAGARFADVVARFSDEPGAASRGGDLGIFLLSNMVPEFGIVVL